MLVIKKFLLTEKIIKENIIKGRGVNINHPIKTEEKPREILVSLVYLQIFQLVRKGGRICVPSSFF